MTPRGILEECFQNEGMPIPSVMLWPMEEDGEKDRRKREDAFARRTGFPPGMKWLGEHRPVKYRPDLVLPGCRSVLISSLGYFRDDAVDHQSIPAFNEHGVPSGRVSRFARGRDYHKELGHRLKRIARSLHHRMPSHQFRAFTDVGPLDEVWLAEASGAAFRGRHGLAILPKLGSWAVLGHILTDASFPSSPQPASPPHCPRACRRCINACPTGALSMPGAIDAEKCLSYHTIEIDEPLPHEFRDAAGDRVFGCDACQECCPFNAGAELTDVAAFRLNIAGPAPTISSLLTLRNHADITSAFAGSSLMRAKHSGLLRNACIAAGNSGSAALIPQLEALTHHHDNAVREHAVWALAKIRRRQNADAAPN